MWRSDRSVFLTSAALPARSRIGTTSGGSAFSRGEPSSARGEPAQGAEVVPRARLGDVARENLALGSPQADVCDLRQVRGVGVGVPDGQRVHAGELPHRPPVRPDRREHDPPALLGREAPRPAGDLEAGRQPLDVPLPRTGQRLVEVVDVEDEVPLGRGEGPEVGQVRVPARLHRQARPRGARQVAGHRQRRAAEERERRGSHPPVADGQQFRHTVEPLPLQQRHRIRPVRPDGKVRVAAARHLRPRCLSLRLALFAAGPR